MKPDFMHVRQPVTAVDTLFQLNAQDIPPNSILLAEIKTVMRLCSFDSAQII